MSSDAVAGQAHAHRLAAIVVVIHALVVFDIVALLFSASLHIHGVHVALGSMVFEEPQIIPAAVIEGLAAGIFAVAAYAIFSGRRGAWRMTLVAHVFAILVLLLGIFARRTGSSPFNQVSHLILLGVFVIGLALLLIPGRAIALYKARHGAINPPRTTPERR